MLPAPPHALPDIFCIFFAMHSFAYVAYFVFLGKCLAKLVAHLLATAALGSNPDNKTTLYLP
jgi:hypothetical protein